MKICGMMMMMMMMMMMTPASPPPSVNALPRSPTSRPTSGCKEGQSRNHVIYLPLS